MKDKAQIQLGESTAVVIVIIILLFIGLVIYYSFARAEQSSEIAEQRDLKTLELGTRVSYIPELHCTFAGRSSTNCFDKIKLEYVSDNSNSAEWQNHYFDVLGYARVEVRQIYPKQQDYLIYENNKSEYQSESPIFIPMNIYDAVEDKYSFGYLMVTKYS